MSDFLHHLGPCPVCNRRLRSDRATLVEKTARFAFVAVECSACASSLLVAAFKQEAGTRHAHVPAEDVPGLTMLVGMVSDLTAADARQLLKRPAVTLDDVLALHAHLEKKETRNS